MNAAGLDDSHIITVSLAFTRLLGKLTYSCCKKLIRERNEETRKVFAIKKVAAKIILPPQRS